MERNSYQGTGSDAVVISDVAPIGGLALSVIAKRAARGELSLMGRIISCAPQRIKPHRTSGWETRCNGSNATRRIFSSLPARGEEVEEEAVVMDRHGAGAAGVGAANRREGTGAPA